METPHRIIVERLLQDRRIEAAAERLARLGTATQRVMPTPAPTRSAPTQPRATSDTACGDAPVAREAA